MMQFKFCLPASQCYAATNPQWSVQHISYSGNVTWFTQGMGLCVFTAPPIVWCGYFKRSKVGLNPINLIFLYIYIGKNAHGSRLFLSEQTFKINKKWKIWKSFSSVCVCTCSLPHTGHQWVFLRYRESWGRLLAPEGGTVNDKPFCFANKTAGHQWVIPSGGKVRHSKKAQSVQLPTPLQRNQLRASGFSQRHQWAGFHHVHTTWNTFSVFQQVSRIS